MALACHSRPLADDAANEMPSAGGAFAKAGAAGIGAVGGGGAGRGDSGGSGGRPPSDVEPNGGAGGEHVAGASGNEPKPDPFGVPARCSSQRTRDPNEAEAPEMNPGFACILCHAASNAATGEADAPIFAFAGTLYATGHEPSSCIGGGDGAAQVLVRDADGQELSALANASGNFLFEDAILKPPFSAKVLLDGRERAATTPHRNPDCNVCHTQLGEQGAPGRVVLP
jgi:hypothetical protein